MRNEVTKNDIMRVVDLVVDHYGYMDEWVESDIVFIVEYVLGETDNKPDDYMIDIINEVFPESYGFMDNHKKIDTLTKEQFSTIKSGVLNHHRCVDEYMIADILFIIEYAFGLKSSYIPDDYMLEIIESVFK
jgi:hypothetical protein